MSTDERLNEQLRALLGDAAFVAAGRLAPERHLATRLGVSRRALRAALARLEAEGLIWRRQGQGTFVSALRPRVAPSLVARAADSSPAEMMEVRLELEPVLARLCALRATRGQVEQLRHAAIVAARAEDAERFERADMAFHHAVAAGANNAVLLAMFELAMAVLREADWRVARQSTFSHSRRAEVFHQHDDIVHAVDARDPAGAEASMRAHLRSVYDYLQSRPL